MNFEKPKQEEFESEDVKQKEILEGKGNNLLLN